MKVTVLLLFVALSIAAPSQDDETKCCCTTYDMSVCLSKIHEDVDTDLNKTYQKALQLTGKFGSTDLQNLKEAQKKWLAYRNAACNAEYGLWQGGSGGPNAQALCVIRLTRQRTADLKNVYTKLNR
jgi:uncharacterized protein YecT (DUF1311 family)